MKPKRVGCVEYLCNCRYDIYQDVAMERTCPEHGKGSRHYHIYPQPKPPEEVTPPSKEAMRWALNQQFWGDTVFESLRVPKRMLNEAVPGTTQQLSDSLVEMLESMPDAETAFTSYISTKDLPQYDARVLKADPVQLTEDVLLRAVEQQEKQVRAYHAKMQVDQKLWTPQQGVSYAETGCMKCVDGTDERDQEFRCLEHRDAFMEDTDGFEWIKQYRRYEFATHGIADIDLPDPHDTIEARHRRAARRWGAVKASYRR